MDYDTLVSEDWCAEEVRTRLLLERGAAGLPSDAPEPPPGEDGEEWAGRGWVGGWVEGVGGGGGGGGGEEEEEGGRMILV